VNRNGLDQGREVTYLSLGNLSTTSFDLGIASTVFEEDIVFCTTTDVDFIVHK